MTARWLFAAALLPGVYWDLGTDTAPALREAGIESLHVPAARLPEWRAAGLTAVPFDPAAHAQAVAPGVEYRTNVASATRAPWVDANGWRYAREPERTWFCEARGNAAALAAAEAFAWRVSAVVKPDPAGLAALGRMLAFLRRVEGPALPAIANIAVIDDGSEITAEVLNLLARRNLLFRVTKAPAPPLLTVRIGSPDYPLEEAADPHAVAAKVRQRLTDEKRLARIFGSEVVLVRLEGDGRRARLHLLNYAQRPASGLRVRLLGEYREAKLSVFGAEDTAPLDWAAAGGATEFTVPTMGPYAVVDLWGGHQAAAGL